jgi:hypothetical protein
MTAASRRTGGKGAYPDRAARARSRPTAERIARTLSQGDDPADALLRIAEEAEAIGDLALAIEAWKGLLPYVYARPKPVQIEPDTVVALVELLEEARRADDEEPSESDRIRDAMLGRMAEVLGLSPEDWQDEP